MAFTYDWREFLHHQEVWQSKYYSAETLSFSDGPTHVGTDQSMMAQVLRVRYMMLTEGVDPTEEGKKGKVFHFIQMFLAHHVDTLFKAGLVRLHDGQNAVVAPELAVAMHQAFVGDPPPMPKTVSVDAVIQAAKEKYFSWVHPPAND